MTLWCLTAVLLVPAGSRLQSVRELDPSAIVRLTNESRRQAKLEPLRVDDKLAAAARAKLADMLKRDYFAHRSPEGREPWSFVRAAGYRYSFVGENLARGYTSEADLQRGWMRSRRHRANILSRHYADIGVATRNGVAVVLFGKPADQE
jgi:uncharacterized protein YkwD